MSPRRHRDSAGASLPNRLMILLAVPLVAVGVASSAQAAGQIRVAHQSQRIRELVADAVSVHGAQLGIEAEIVPSLARLEYERLSRMGAQGRREATILRTTVLRELPGLRAATDASFVRANSAIGNTDARIRLRTLQYRLIALRTSNALSTYPLWSALLNDLDGVEDTLLSQAHGAGLDSRTSDALDDVRAVARASQYGGQLVASLISTELAGPNGLTAARAEFERVWGTYQTSSRLVSQETSEPLRSAWVAATRSSVSKTENMFLTSYAATSARPTTADLRTLGPASRARQIQFNAVLDDSFDRATRAAAHSFDAARRNVAIVVGLDALLLAITIGLALLVRAWVTRSLNGLAVQAGQISEGVLPDVKVTGPREVRTVARALDSAVATLRNIQKQADAMADGTIDAEQVASASPGPLGHLVHASIVRVLDAMRSQELAQQELAHRAAHDPLTDLPNRGYVVDLLNRSLHRAQRNGVMTGLLFIDLDHFKAINDTFGHAAGDFVLQTASKRMAQAVREGDVVARLGGDEFVVLLEDLSSETRFVELGKRLVEALAEPMMFEGRALRIGASIGVAVCRDGAVDGDRLMREADAAVYRAKAGGRNRVEIFDEDLRRELSAHTDMDAALHRALTNDEFLVFYQPVVDISTGAATGMEALIRWDRPGFGMVPPNDFIPVAESSTLINDIGRWVLGEATRQLAEWTERDPTSEHLTIAVNISGRHLVSSELVQDVADALARSGIAPHRLVIELTETMLVDNARCGANMLGLRRLGVQVALDDFGTGYTSIGQLQKLPIDMLKIDRSFVSSTDRSQLELCKLMVSAGRALGLGVIAEGVETDAQADALRHIHVQSCQGFLFARPMPAGDVDTVRLTEPAAGRTHV